ncbi:hypothetical protein ACLMJK_005621 [Lecanora helva]
MRQAISSSILSLLTLSTHAASLLPRQSPPNTTTSPQTYQATITGYTGSCGTVVGSCGFLGTPGSYQCAMSAYWQTPGLPGQCGTCWQLSNARNANGDGTIAGPINSAPIVVMTDNACASNPADPTGSCNTSPEQLKDRWGSDTAVDLCVDTGAADALFGRRYENQGGVAVADLVQVDCGAQWKGTVDPGSYVDWTGYVATPGQPLAAVKKPA